MIHENKDEFIKALGRASKKKGFLLPLIEKDYYLTLILSRIHELSENLVFKGGTCLNISIKKITNTKDNAKIAIDMIEYVKTLIIALA